VELIPRLWIGLILIKRPTHTSPKFFFKTPNLSPFKPNFNMKKFFVILLTLLFLAAGVFFYNQSREVKVAPEKTAPKNSTTTKKEVVTKVVKATKVAFDFETWKSHYLKNKENAKQWDKDFCQGYTGWFDPKLADQYFVNWGPLGIRTLMNDSSWGPEGLKKLRGWWQRNDMDGFQKTWPKPLVDADGNLIVNSFSVKHVIPGSPADGHLQEGDLLLALNGHPFLTSDEARGDKKPWVMQYKRSLALGAGLLLDKAEAKKKISFTLLRIPKDQMAQLPTPPAGTVVEKDGKLNLPEALKPYLKTVSFDIQPIGAYDPTKIGGGKKIENIIKMQAAWLVKNQQPDGSWERMHGYTMSHFDTAWAMIGLMSTGDPQYDPAIHKAAKFLSTCKYDKWAGPRGIALLAASEYYLKYKDESYLPTVQRWVDSLEGMVLPDMTIGHGHGPGYRGGSVAYGGSHVTVALAVAMKTPAKVPAGLLDQMLERVQQLAPEGKMPYGRYQKNKAFKTPDEESSANYNANHGPHLVSSLIHGGPKTFTENCSALYSKGSVGDMDRGHATETMSTTWGLIAANMVSPEAYQRHLNTMAWKLSLLRTYRGGFGKSAYILDYQGAEKLLDYALRSGAWLTALCAPRHELAITGNPKYKAHSFADIPPVNSYNANHLNYCKRNWGVAHAVIKARDPKAKFLLDKKLPDLLAIPADDQLPGTLASFLEKNAHPVAAEILKMKKIEQPLRSYLAELVLGVDVTIDVLLDKKTGEWGIKVENELPFAATNKVIPNQYLVKGTLTVEKNGQKVGVINLPVSKPEKKKKSKKTKYPVSLSVQKSDQVSAHIQYSVGDLHFDYRRPLKYLPTTVKECARVLINDRQVWVPGTLIGNHFGWNLSFNLPSGQRIAAASLGMTVEVYPPENSSEKPWHSPEFDKKTQKYAHQLKAGTQAKFLYVSARRKAEARIPAVQLKP